MQRRQWSAVIAFWVLLAASLPAVAPDPSQGLSTIAPFVGGSEVSPPRVPSDFFTENAGQIANPEVLYYARGGGVSVGFAAGAVLVNLRESAPHYGFNPRSGLTSHPPADPEAPAPPLRGHLIRIAFEGANPVLPHARGELPHRANFFLGDDPAVWRTNVRNYREIVYENAWDGIDVVYRPSPGGMKYDLVVHPGAELADVAFTYEGVADLAVNRNGLTAETSLGPVRDDLPAAWQASGRPVDCAFRQTAERTVGYACSGWDGTGDLVIDPLQYSTFLGGSGDEWGNGIALEPSGAVYVTGETYDDAPAFPATPGAYDTSHNGWSDAFVAKLDPSGSALLYATFLGGSGLEWGFGIAVDAAGAAYVTGTTSDDVTDFPTTPGAVDTTHNGGIGDAFVTKLDANGSTILYSTFLGGSKSDGGYGIAVDAAGAVYVTGETEDDVTDFPTTPGAYDTTHNGVIDVFVAKLDASGGTLAYSTFLGGSGDDYGDGIVVDGSGVAYVTGTTKDDVTDFPATPGADDASHNGAWFDVFVAKLNASGGSLLYSTFLGGGGDDYGDGIAVAASGAVYVTGETYDDATDFPTTPGAYDTTHNGAEDGFIAKIDANGSTLLYSTFIGGGGDDFSSAIAVDASDTAYVTGSTFDDATDFPTTPSAYDATHNGRFDVFVAKLNANGSALLYSTFLGGSGDDYANGFSADASGAVYVTGATNSTAGFPSTPGAYDVTYNGAADVFLAKVTFAVPPVLAPTGELNYVVDGVDPEADNLAATYAYRVNYTDADGDPPVAGDPKIHILKRGVEIMGSPFPMGPVDPADTTYTDGKWYAYATPLAPRGTDYTYYFTATDAIGLAAVDWPSPPADAPDVLNRAPTADAGADQPGMFRNPVVSLNGTASSDPDGDPPTFTWTQTAGPPVPLTGSDTATPFFTPAAAGTYTFELRVDDGFGGNSTDVVTVTVVNRAPAAEAGGPYTCQVGEAITLDGDGSADPEGDALSYSWTVDFTPAATLAGPTPTLVCPTTSGTFNVTLAVTDLGGLSDIDGTPLSIEREPGGPAIVTDWTLPLLGLLLVAAVMLFMFFFWRRRKRQEEATKTPPPPNFPEGPPLDGQ